MSQDEETLLKTVLSGTEDYCNAEHEDPAHRLTTRSSPEGQESEPVIVEERPSVQSDTVIAARLYPRRLARNQRHSSPRATTYPQISCGTPTDRGATPAWHFGTPINRSPRPVGRCGTPSNRGPIPVGRLGTPINRGPTPVGRLGTTINRGSASVHRLMMSASGVQRLSLVSNMPGYDYNLLSLHTDGSLPGNG